MQEKRTSESASSTTNRCSQREEATAKRPLLRTTSGGRTDAHLAALVATGAAGEAAEVVEAGGGHGGRHDATREDVGVDEAVEAPVCSMMRMT